MCIEVLRDNTLTLFIYIQGLVYTKLMQGQHCSDSFNPLAAVNICSRGYLDRVPSTGRLPPRETIPRVIIGWRTHFWPWNKSPTKISSSLCPPRGASISPYEFCWRSRNICNVRTKGVTQLLASSMICTVWSKSWTYPFGSWTRPKTLVKLVLLLDFFCQKNSWGF